MGDNSVLEILEKASGLVDTRWCQGHQLPEKLCLWYAILEGARLPDKISPSYDLAEAVVVAQLGKEQVQKATRLGNTAVLIKWNDEPGRTKEEVLAVLRAARQEVQGGSQTG